MLPYQLSGSIVFTGFPLVHDGSVFIACTLEIVHKCLEPWIIPGTLWAELNRARALSCPRMDPINQCCCTIDPASI